MTIKLVAIDIDDTLLDSNGQLTEKTKVIVQKAVAQGVYIVLCTGRPLVGIAKYLKALQIRGENQCAITYNGGLSQSIAGKILNHHTLTKNDFYQITAFCKKHNVHYNVLDDQGNIYTTDDDISKYTVIQAWENFAGINHLDSVAEIDDNFIMAKALLVDEQSELDRVTVDFEKQFGSKYYIVRSTPVFLEALNMSANKGSALSDLTRELGLKPEEVMAIGDEKNDLPMLEFAGTAVAMGNATTLVKKTANYETADNNHNGVAEAISKFVLE